MALPDPESPPVHSSQEEHNALVISFLAVRQTLGWLGLFLPVALLAYASLPGHRLEDSISDFYYTGMGDVFVGTLCAIGVFLLSYTGYEPLPGERLSDKWLARTAGAAAILVALFPVRHPDYPFCTGNPPICLQLGFAGHSEIIHYVAAGTFFLCLALFSLFQFTRGERGTDGRLRWSVKATIYVLCGTAILANLVALVPYYRADPAARAAAADRHYLFWVETVAVLAFSISWLTKGKALAGLVAMARKATGMLAGS